MEVEEEEENKLSKYKKRTEAKDETEGVDEAKEEV